MTKQVAVFDVDDTLLDYTSTLYDWIGVNGLKRPRKKNDIDYGEASKIFNETFHMRNIKPLSNTLKVVKSFHDSGFKLIIVSSFSNKYQAHQMRIENLENVYGKVFSDYFFSNWENGQRNKKDVIRNQLDNNNEVYYFDDDFDIFYNFEKIFNNDINENNLKMYRIDTNNDWLDIMKDLKWD